MAMSLRVVVPPHPLIGHWLSVLRDRQTPAPLYATAMAELGRWLSYEAIRDWLPHRRVVVQTDLAETESTVVDPTVPLLAMLMLPEGLGLWSGAQPVLPAARVAHLLIRAEGALEGLPDSIDPRAGVLIFCDQLATGARLAPLVQALAQRGVGGPRLRLITALCASPGLQRLGEAFPELTIYCACIDPEVSAAGRIVPGIGSVADRLFGGPVLEASAAAA